MSARFLIGTVFDAATALPDDSVDLILSSPPFLALRSYLPADHPTKAKEIGSEATPADFLDTLLDVVEACGRVLTPHGSLVFELGDSYSGSGGAGGDYGKEGLRKGQEKFDGTARRIRDSNMPRVHGTHPMRSHSDDLFHTKSNGRWRSDRPQRGWPADKSLCFVPQLFGASLAYGRNLLRPERTIEPWRIRNVVAWCRPNPPVGSLGDKFRPATSYLTVATKSRQRYFDLDAVRIPSDYHRPNLVGNGSRSGGTPGGQRPNSSDHTSNPADGPPLDWWEIPTAPYKGSHYATWPPALLIRPILSMCPERVCRTCGEPSRRIVGDYTLDAYRQSDRAQTQRAVALADVGSTWTDCGHDDYRRGVVLDPFAGSGTTLMVASGHGRDAIGIDFDERNADLARERVGMWLEAEHVRSLGGVRP